MSCRVHIELQFLAVLRKPFSLYDYDIWDHLFLFFLRVHIKKNKIMNGEIGKLMKT